MKIRRDVLVTVINALCTIACALLAGCKFSCGELSFKDFSSAIVLPYMIDYSPTNSPSYH